MNPNQSEPAVKLAESPRPDDRAIHRSPSMIVAAIAAGVMVVIGGWLVFNHSHGLMTGAKPLTHISVRLEWLNNPEFAGMYVAKDKGYYQAAGLDVDLKEFGDNTDVNQEVADGTVDYGVSTPLEVILARDKGENNKGIAAIYQTSAYSIVARPSAHITTPADFKGKVLGNLGDNNEAKVTYAALLASAGLKSTDATIKPVDFDIVKVFESDQADTGDVYRTDEPYLLNQAHIPFKQLYPEQFGFAIYGDVLIASDAKIAKNPAQALAFVQATLKGWQYAIDHQTETLAILSKYDNALYKDPGYVKYDLAATAALVKPNRNLDIGSMSFVPWNRAFLAVKQANLLTSSLNPESTYTLSFVAQ